MYTKLTLRKRGGIWDLHGFGDGGKAFDHHGSHSGAFGFNDHLLLSRPMGSLQPQGINGLNGGLLRRKGHHSSGNLLGRDAHIELLGYGDGLGARLLLTKGKGVLKGGGNGLLHAGTQRAQ